MSIIISSVRINSDLFFTSELTSKCGMSNYSKAYKWKPALLWSCSKGYLKSKIHVDFALIVLLVKKKKSFSYLSVSVCTLSYLKCIGWSNRNVSFWAHTIRFVFLHRQAESVSKEMKQIMGWFGTLEQHTAGGNKGEALILFSSQLVQKQGCSQSHWPLCILLSFLSWRKCAKKCSTSLQITFLRFHKALSPVYNHNIIIPTTCIDLFTALSLEQPNGVLRRSSCQDRYDDTN